MEQDRERLLSEQINRVSILNGQELKEWLAARINGVDPILPDDPDYDAAYSLVALIPHLSGAVVAQIQYAALALLTQWLQTQSLPPSATDTLLLIIQGLQVKPAGNRLELFVKSDGFADMPAPIQDRILQTLIALETNLPPHFWFTLVALDPERFAGVAFDGLALVSPNQAVDLLTKLPESETIAASIAASLPGFMDNIFPARSRVAVRSLIASRIWQVAPPIKKIIQEFFAGEQTPVATADIVRDWRAGQILINTAAYPALVARQQEVIERTRELRNVNPARVLLEACQ